GNGHVVRLVCLPKQRSSDLTIPSVNLKREASGMNRNKKRLKPKIVYPTAKKLNSAVAVANIKAAIRFMPVRNVERLVFPTLNNRSEEHTSELQSRFDLVCRL